LYCLAICFVIYFCYFYSSGVSSGIRMINEHKVGIFDVKVVKSDSSKGLIAWLNENKFNFNASDKKVFDSYIKQGWHFVVANINPGKDQKEDEIVSEGLAAPLILRFATKQPIYPLALTGTGGFKTKILIYFLSDKKMTCGNRLKLRYANERKNNGSILKQIVLGTEPIGFFDEKEFSEKSGLYRYLSKFRDTLAPAEMSQDIVFKPAKDNTPYREHIVKW